MSNSKEAIKIHKVYSDIFVKALAKRYNKSKRQNN